MSANWPPLMIAATATLTACATAGSTDDPKAQNIWLVRYVGNDEAYSSLRQAAKNCQYSDVEEVLGQHLEPQIHIVIPRHRSVEYECLRQWMKNNKQLGFGVPPPSKG